MYLTEEEIEQAAKEHFQGFDYGEVFAYLGIAEQDFESPEWDKMTLEDIFAEDEKYHQKLRDIISLASAEVSEKVLSSDNKKILLACRAYIRAVANLKNPLTCSHPLWVGLNNVEDDWTFLQKFSLLFPYIWE